MTLKITETIGGYDFAWAEEHLAIKVSRVRVHAKDGRVTGEVLITSDDKTIYPPTVFNFNADTTRTRLANTLLKEYPQWEWAHLLKQVSNAVSDRAREGEPVKELWTNEDAPAPEWLVAPILYKGLPTIIFGEKGVTKSTFGLLIYVTLLLPWGDNPLGWIPPTRPVKTLLLDYEVNYEVAHSNFNRLQKGLQFGHLPLFYRRCYIPLADDIEAIHRHVTNIGAEALIVDSLGPAVGGDLKDPAEALRFNSALRQLNLATLIIGQTSKDKESKVKSTFGTVFFEYYARNIFELRKVQDEGEGDIETALFNTYNNLNRTARAQGFRLHFNEDSTSIETCLITAHDLVARQGAQAQILLLLKDGPASTKDLMDRAGIVRSTADGALKRLKDKKLILRKGELWGLLAL